MATVTAMAAGTAIADITMAGTGDAATGVIITTSLTGGCRGLRPETDRFQAVGFWRGIAPLLNVTSPRRGRGPETEANPNRTSDRDFTAKVRPAIGQLTSQKASKFTSAAALRHAPRRIRSRDG